MVQFDQLYPIAFRKFGFISMIFNVFSFGISYLLVKATNPS